MICIATQNEHKLKEIQSLLTALPIPLSTLPQNSITPEETGQTFLENALIKAKNCLQITSLPSLSDDSGLCVSSLQGKPGVHSARFAGNKATSTENRELLLSVLKNQEERKAYFVCVFVFLLPNAPFIPLVSQGIMEGTIAKKEEGFEGFGYDSIFIPKGEKETLSILGDEFKKKRSHRAIASEQFISNLPRYLESLSNPLSSLKKLS